MTDKIPYDDFAKLDLRVGQVIDVQAHPKADKLYILTVDLGEEKPRTIVAGLRPHYEAEELKNKKAIFIANLQPVILRGIESNGMILAASNEDKTKVHILTPDNDLPVGSKVS